MTATLDELAGPADADMFRMTVDWGRWYIDPLPTCEIAEATEDRWPSCTQVKKAADKDWSFLTVNRIAALPPVELHRIADLDHTQRGDAVRSHEKFAKNIAFGRGAIVHLWAEDLAEGREPRKISDSWLAANGYPTAARTEATIYRAAMIDFFQTYQPEFVAKEYVTIHRTLNGKGYGATPDGLFRIEGEVVGVDWKTRGEGSSHAAYAEEAAQIACGARAEYMIARVDDHAERRRLPDIAGGYVVSIKPDGARLYPVDIDKAWTHWTHLHEWWAHKLDEKTSIGRVKPKRTQPKNSSESQPAVEADSLDQGARGAPEAATGVSVAGKGTGSPTSSTPPSGHAAAPEPSWRAEASRRYKLLNDAQRLDYTERKQSIDTSDPAAVFALLDAVDPVQTVSVEPATSLMLRVGGRPFACECGSNVFVKPADLYVCNACSAEYEGEEAPPTPPDEGAEVDVADVMALSARYERLNAHAKAWTGSLVSEGNRAFTWRIKDRPTVRRYELYRGVITLAEVFYGKEGE